MDLKIYNGKGYDVKEPKTLIQDAESVDEIGNEEGVTPPKPTRELESVVSSQLRFWTEPRSKLNFVEAEDLESRDDM